MGFFKSEEVSNDINLLPFHLQSVYKNPYRLFGLDESSATVAQVREAFRKYCLIASPYFSGLGNIKVTIEQVIFAYYIIRGALKRDLLQLHEILSDPDNPYLAFSPDDVLPLLRPMSSSFSCPKEYRGFRMLIVNHVSSRREFSFPKLTRIVYSFDVHYCMRKHSVSLDYDAFYQLYEELKEELLTVPIFPSDPYSFDLGTRLADFIVRVHSLLGAKQLFSARLLKFLGIDFERVHSEEEGAILAILDTPNLPRQVAPCYENTAAITLYIYYITPLIALLTIPCHLQTHWHMLSEQWLQKWRRFAMGRGARRYIPPGKITNRELLDSYSDMQRRLSKELKLAKDYRCVNYNVWRFYQLVHGGGPCICRQDEDIYSERTCSHLQAVIMIQSQIRTYLAKVLKDKLYIKQFSLTSSARELMFGVVKQAMDDKVEDIINDAKSSRKNFKLEQAALFTQILWRRKKNYVPDIFMATRVKDQEVFNRSRPKDEEGDEDFIRTDGGVIVQDALPIVHIGTTSHFSFTVSDSEGRLPFKTKRMAGSEIALIADTKNEQLIPNGSKILNINKVPMGAFTYEQVKKKLVSAALPIVLEMEKPLRTDQLPTLDGLLSIKDEKLQYNGFKMLLSTGIYCIKHSAPPKRSSHLSVLRISDKELFYRRMWQVGMTENDLWKRLSLFSIKFVIKGADSETIGKKTSNVRNPVVNPAFCFEFSTTDKSLTFEIPEYDRMLQIMVSSDCDPINERDEKKKEAYCEATHKIYGVGVPKFEAYIKRLKNTAKQDVKTGTNALTNKEYHERKCAMVYANLKKLVMEIRSTQIFVDKDGMPTMRTKAKTSLRTVSIF